MNNTKGIYMIRVMNSFQIKYVIYALMLGRHHTEKKTDGGRDEI